MFTPETWQMRNGDFENRGKISLGGGNSNMFGIFTPKLGEDEPNLMHIVQRGW